MRSKYYRCLNTGVVFRKSDFKTDAKKGGLCFSHHKNKNIKPVDKKLNTFFDKHLAKQKLIGSCGYYMGKREYLFKEAA